MNRRDRHPSSIALYLISAAFSSALWVFYFANVVHASDCPPNDPSRIDCANAAQTANNPATPASGTVAGTGTSIAIDRLRNRRRGRSTPKPPTDYGPGRTNVWDPPVDEQTRKWVDDGLVWDPQTLSWRPPKPGEIPPPPDAPEKPPPYELQHPRDKVPPDCLELYDAYVKEQAKVIAMEDQIKFASEAQQDAQFKFNQLLAKFTLKLGWDVGDTVLLAVGVAHLTVALGQMMSKYLPRTLAEALESSRSILTRASSKVSEIGSAIADAFRRMTSTSQIAQGLREAAESLMSKASSLRKLLTSAEKQAEELASLESKAARTAEEASAATGKLDAASKKVSELTEKLSERAGAESAWNRLRAAHDAWQPLFEEQMRVADELSKAEQTLADRVDGIRKAAFKKLDAFEDNFSRLLDSGTPIDAIRAQRTAIANECQQAFEAGKVAAQNEIVKPIQDRFNAIRDKVIPLGEERVSAWEAAKQYFGGSGANYDTPPRIVSETTEAGLRELLQAAQSEVTQLTSHVGELTKAVDEARAAYESLKASAAAALAALPQYRQDLPGAESDANEAQRKAKQADDDAQQAKAEYEKAQADLAAAKQEEGTAQQEFDKLNTQANAEIKSKFAETPQEVATVLINARDDVKRIVDKLKELQAERDKLMDDLKWLKPKLDSCVDEHTPYGGSSVSNN